MNSLSLDFMDPQKLLAEAGQQDEDAPEPTLPPPPELTPATHGHIATLQHHQPTVFEMPTTFPMRMQDASQATPWGTLQPWQQPPAMSEYNHIHKPPLSSKAQRELMIEEHRHSEARKRILERNQTYPIVLQEEQDTHSYSDASLDIYGGTDAPTFDFSSACMASDQTLESRVMNNGSNSHGFGPGPWHTQTTPQDVSNPSPFSVYAQDPTLSDTPSHYVQHNDPSSSYLPMNFRQPTMEQMPLQPVLEQMPLQPLMDQMPLQPLMEQMPLQSSIEQMPLQPSMEQMPLQPSMEQMPLQPLMEHMPLQSAMEQMPLQPSMEQMPLQPSMEQMPLQPVMEQMPPRLSSYNAPDPFLNAHGQEVPAPIFSALAQIGSTQGLSIQNDGTQLSAQEHASSTPFATNSNFNMAASATVPPLLDDIYHSGYHTPGLRQTYLPSFPVVDQSNTLDPDTAPAGPFQTQTPVTKTSRKRTQSSPALANGRTSASRGGTKGTVKTGVGLDNMHLYKSPEAEREYNRNRKRTHMSNGRVDEACFACWLHKGKCTRSPEGPCLRCQNLLKRFSHLTSIYELRCDGRTKFSKLPIFTTPAAIPDYSWELREAGHDIPTESGIFSTTPLQLLTRIGLALLKPVRNILDIFEPRHVRQIWPDQPLALLSYSFSIFRRRREILFLKPSLAVELTILERLHHWRLRLLLAELDDSRLYSSREYAAMYLNIMFEGIHSMDSSHLVDNSAKELLQSALENRIAYLYCILFPTDSTMDDLELNISAVIFNGFKSTSRLLPPRYHTYAAGQVEDAALHTHRDSSDSNWGSSMDATDSIRQNPPRPPEGSFPTLVAYTPARFLAAFGFDAEALRRIGQDINDPYHHHMNNAERELKELVTIDWGHVPQDYLFTTPIALSFGAEIVVSELATTENHGGREVEMMFLIIAMSVLALNDFSDYSLVQLSAGEGMWFQEPFPGTHAIMHTWAEDTSWIQKTKTAHAKKIRDFWEVNKPGLVINLHVLNGFRGGSGPGPASTTTR